MIATLLIAGASAASGPAMGQGKVIVYTSNDSNLNRLRFEAFKKETGIEVEQVEAGSGVIFRRMPSERERPLGDIVWGVSRTLLRANKALLAPYASKNKDAVPAQFRDPDDLWIGSNVHILVILQNTKLIRERRPQELGRPDGGEVEGQGGVHRSGQFRLRLFQPHHAGRPVGDGEAGWEKVAQLLANTRVLNRSSLVFQGVGNGGISARHVARICRLPVVLERCAP
jgi:iron(III) transport system substrate-binding protein